MRVLLAGYHGQENLGDDLTDLLTVRSIVEEFGDIELYLLNFGATPRPIFSQTSLVEGIVDSSPTTRGHVRRTEQVWFDVLDQQSFDLVAVNNSSMYGSGKTNFEIGAIAQRLGIRTRYLCLKEYLSKGYYGDFQKAVPPARNAPSFATPTMEDLGEEFLKALECPARRRHGAKPPSVFPCQGETQRHTALSAMGRRQSQQQDHRRDQHLLIVTATSIS